MRFREWANKEERNGGITILIRFDMEGEAECREARMP